jgi:hypothetical protein
MNTFVATAVAGAVCAWLTCSIVFAALWAATARARGRGQDPSHGEAYAAVPPAVAPPEADDLVAGAERLLADAARGDAT